MTGLIMGVTGIVAVIAAQATGSPSGDLAPYVSGGGAAAAVGGLIWYGRQQASGRIVPRDVAEEARQLKALIAQGADRERRLEQQCEAGADRERTYHSMLVRGQQKRGPL